MTSYPATSPVDPAYDIFQVHATGNGVSDSNFRIDAGAAWPSLHPGTYQFTFDEPPGWTITGITCSGTDTYDNFSKTLTITLDALENMTCSIVSSAEGGSITIMAGTHPDAGPLPATNFGAVGTIQGGQSSFDVSGFTLDTDSATATPDSITFSDLPGGVYTFTESVPAGWRLGYISCFGYGEETDLANRFARITLEPNENQTCFFSNTQTAALHIVNDATPDTSEEWDLTIDDGNGYVLDTTIDGMPGGAHGFDYANPGTYTVTLGPKAGWNLTGLSCTTGEQGNLASRSVSVTLSATEETTCTFTNVRPAKVTIIEDSLPDDAQDFAYSGTLGALSLDDDSNGTLPRTREFSDLNPGTFTVTQGAVTGWDTALSCTGGQSTDQATRTATIVLTSGDQITCTFTNTRRGSITVVQDSRPDSAQDFSFATTVGAFPLDDDADGTLPATSTLSDQSAGSYTVTQGSVAGWDLTDLSCTRTGGTANESVSLANRTASITLDPGEHVTCTFQTTQRGSITVADDSRPDGAQDFAYSGTLGALSLDDDTDGTLPASSALTNLVPGPYVVSQGAVPGWDLTDLTCTRTGGTANESIGLATQTATITLDPGEQLTCTFQNTERGRITIVQQATPKAGDGFPFTGDLGPFSLRDDNDPSTPDTASFFTVLPGRYDVTQQLPSGWWLDDVSCVRTGGIANESASVVNATVALFVDPGEQLTCTFTSVAFARITVSVDASPDNAADFAFTGDLGPFSLDDDADGTLDRSHLFGTLMPGTYSIESTPTPGWTLTGLGCTGPHAAGVRTVTVTVAPGDDVSCGFTNTLDPIPATGTGGGTPGTGGMGGGSTTSDIGSAGASTSVFDGISPTGADGSLTTADAGDLPSSDSQASAPKDGDTHSGAPSPDVGGFPAWWLALIALGLLPLLLYFLRRWNAT